MSRGFTLIEVAISLTVLAILMGSVAGSLARDNSTHQALVAHMGPEMKMRRVLHRMATEIRMAGVWGEDRDHDGVLDEGEDLNLNGHLDADWNLADGQERADLAFNARQDLRDEDGTVIATGIYSPRTRFYLQGGTLYRERIRIVEDEPQVVRAVLATRVKELQFARDAGVVTVRVTVSVELGGGRLKDHVLETRVWLRN
ncbi:MAG: prepilin-type N-terminal cleavage/methylation domain-containing protein [Planctomycetota bacterium]